MIVHKCNASIAVKAEPKKLTLEEIKKKEGVYKLCRPGNLRFIVLKYNSITSVLIYQGGGILEPASESLWSRATFLEVEGAQVCFEIKEP